jgi:hypothetical protein
MWQTKSIDVANELNVNVTSNFSFKGKGYELSELQKSYGIQKGSHILDFIIPGVYNKSFEKVDYPFELYVNGEKLNKVEIEGAQYFYLNSKKVSEILARAERGVNFGVDLESASGEKFSVDYNDEQFSLSTKMYFTCTENIT